MAEKKKTSIMVDEDLWTEIKIQALRNHEQVGEYIEEIFRESLHKFKGGKK